MFLYKLIENDELILALEWAKENNVTLIDAPEMKIINDKRSKEKNAKK